MNKKTITFYSEAFKMEVVKQITKEQLESFGFKQTETKKEKA